MASGAAFASACLTGSDGNGRGGSASITVTVTASGGSAGDRAVGHSPGRGPTGETETAASGTGDLPIETAESRDRAQGEIFSFTLRRPEAANGKEASDFLSLLRCRP